MDKKIVKNYMTNFERVSKLLYFKVWEHAGLPFSFYQSYSALEKKDYLQKKLRENKIETNQVHFRNDKYSIFKKFAKNCKFPNMDYLEDKYLVLPIHHKLKISEAEYICDEINKVI